MAIKGVTPVLNVSDVPRSLAWFESLGWKRGFTWNDGGMIEGAGDRTARGDAHVGSVCADERAVGRSRVSPSPPRRAHVSGERGAHAVAGSPGSERRRRLTNRLDGASISVESIWIGPGSAFRFSPCFRRIPGVQTPGRRPDRVS